MTTCKNCPLGKPETCVQDLGESVGWQWWPRNTDSWKTCHFNFMEGKEFDPYEHLRRKG